MTKAKYAAYLQTPEWKARAAAIRKRDGYRCKVCNSKDRLQVHHRSYTDIGAEHDADLVTLCDLCHSLFHRHGRLVRHHLGTISVPREPPREPQAASRPSRPSRPKTTPRTTTRPVAETRLLAELADDADLEEIQIIRELRKRRAKQ